MNCSTCGSSNFNVVDGEYFCYECLTHATGTREETVDSEEGTHRRLLVSSPVSKRSPKAETVLYSSWTTSEAYNIIICKQVSALINLGASNKLKDVVLYIWSRYLQKCEVAFFQKDQSEEQLPRLSVYAKKRDLKVLYGDKYIGRKKKKNKVKRTKKKQTNGSKKKLKTTLREVSETNESEIEENMEKEKREVENDMEKEEGEVEENMENDKSEIEENMEKEELGSDSIVDKNCEAESTILNDGEFYEEESKIDNDVYSSHAQMHKDIHKREKKNVNSVTKELCVDNMTLTKTLCFCYLGLLYTGDQLLLSDLIRLVHEGRIPYFRAADCLPPNMKLQCDDHSSFNITTTPDLWKISLMCAKLIDFIALPKFKHRSLIPIVFRFVRDLNLPDNIIHIVKILIVKSKALEDWYETKKASKTKYFPIPLYEVQAMAFIIIVLKMNLVLDGKFEEEHSEVMEKVNVLLKDRKLFIWNKWKRQASLIEYLFMKTGSTYPNISLFDSLSAVEIISKYPFIRSKETGDFPNKSVCANSTARHRISEIFKHLSPLVHEIPKRDPTSFPLRQQIAYLITNWRYLPMYKETKHIDFAFLSEDFSSHQLFFTPTSKDDMSSDDLIALLLSSLYESAEILTLAHSASNYQNILRTTTKYWFKNFSQKQLSGSDWLNTLPSSFQWLLRFLCTYNQISCKNMYCEVLRLEKKLFLHAKRAKI